VSAATERARQGLVCRQRGKYRYALLGEFGEELGMKSYKSRILQLTLTAVFAGLVAATTMMIRFPIPATSGYFNIGDAMIFIAALLFGPVVGGLAGGVGSAIADMIGYPMFVPYTLVIKGIEGWLVGKIARKTPRSDWVACVLGGGEMVLGYFVVEVLLFGIGAALEELPFNVFQIVAGLAIGPAIALLLRRRLPSILSQV
jgi:uncharacterized membrane protein